MDMTNNIKINKILNAAKPKSILLPISSTVLLFIFMTGKLN